MFLFSFSFLLFALANNISVYILASIVVAIARSLYSGSIITWYYRVLEENNGLSWRNDMMSKIELFKRSLSMLAPIISSFLVIYSLTAPLFLASFIAFLTGLVSLLFYKDNKGSLVHKNILASIFAYSVKFFSDKRMRMIFITQLFEQAGFKIFILIWQMEFLHKFKVAENFIGIMHSGLMFSMAVGALFTTLLLRKVSLFKSTFLAKFLIIISFILLIISNNIVLTIFAFLLFDFALSVSQITSSIWINDYISNENRTTYISMISSLQGFFSIFVSLSIGFLVDLLGYNFIWLIALIFALLSMYSFKYFCNYYGNQRELY